jgi:predicted transcriptional regulator
VPLTSRLQGPRLANMEVNFTPQIESQLKEFAARKGKDAAQVVEEAVSGMLERQARFVEGVKRGIESANRGDLIDHEEVVSRIDGLFNS